MLRYLLEKEFKQIFRDKVMPKLIFIMPMMQLVVLPFAANFEMRNINLAVVDADRSETSRLLVGKALSSGYFRLTESFADYDDALASVERNRSDIILEIPRGFERDLGREGQTQVLVAANAVNGTKGGLGSSYLSSIIQDFSAERVVAEGVSPDVTAQVDIRTQALYNPYLNYKNYMVPGIIIFLMTILGGFLSAMNIVSEKETGTIEQINVSPVPKTLFLLSKLIPFWVIGFILLTLGMGVAWLVYGILPAGNVGIVYLFAAIYLVAFTGFGLTLSSVSATRQQALFSAFFFIIIFSLLSGLFTPISSMPEWAQRLTLFNPLRYGVDVMRKVYLSGATLADLKTQFAAILAFAAGFNILAVLSYRKNG